jgi:hypothetical protein
LGRCGPNPGRLRIIPGVARGTRPFDLPCGARRIAPGGIDFGPGAWAKPLDSTCASAGPARIPLDLVSLGWGLMTLGAVMITKDRFTAIAMTLVVWGLSGGVFGALFTGLGQVLASLGLTGWQPPVAAAAAAAMTTSAFYSAMPVALTGAMAGVLASIGALIVFGQDVGLVHFGLAAAVAGLAAGGFYAWMTESGGRPLAETLTGLLSGVIAGGTVVLVGHLVGQRLGTFAMAAGVVALVGVLFQISERWMVLKGSGLLPGGISAGLVAAIVASLVGGSIWVLSGTPAFVSPGVGQDTLGRVGGEILPGFLGGLMGGAATGLLLEFLGFHLEDHASGNLD